jgi:hypothetical protein
VGPKNLHVRLLGTRFTNALSCFEPDPQEPYRAFLNVALRPYPSIDRDNFKTDRELDWKQNPSGTTGMPYPSS